MRDRPNPSESTRILKDEIEKRFLEIIETYIPSDPWCKYCSGVGYHKMSCPTTKITIHLNEGEG